MSSLLRSLSRALGLAALAVTLVGGDAAARPTKPKGKAKAASVAKASKGSKKARAGAARAKASASRASVKRAKGKKAKAVAVATRTRGARGRGAAVTVARGARARKAGRALSRRERVALARLEARREAAERAEARRIAAQRAAAANPVAQVAALPLPEVILPDLATAAPSGPPRPFEALSRSATSLVDQMVARARTQLGTRYVFGGNQPGAGLDCSSFARYAMEALGFRLPRTANQQAQVGRPVPRDPAALKPGDLLTFGSRRRVDHVGIYLGEGRFIHASVKSGRVIETTMDRNNSLFRKWLGARRLVAASDSGREASGG